MREVKIDKGKLQFRVQENRDKHREVYERAMEGYRQEVLKWFGIQMENAMADAGFETAFYMPRPEDHTEDYDRVLDMLTMSEDTVITLTSSEFAQYVRDDWGWKRDFMATSSNYIVPE